MNSTLDFFITRTRILGISSMAILIGQSSILGLGGPTGRSQHFQVFASTDLSQVVSYTPPGCSDTDSDQTNNCGPDDSTDAGTRMSS